MQTAAGKSPLISSPAQARLDDRLRPSVATARSGAKKRKATKERNGKPERVSACFVEPKLCLAVDNLGNSFSANGPRG
jgi:hypothetical protein